MLVPTVQNRDRTSRLLCPCLERSTLCLQLGPSSKWLPMAEQQLGGGERPHLYVGVSPARRELGAESGSPLLAALLGLRDPVPCASAPTFYEASLGNYSQPPGRRPFVLFDSNRSHEYHPPLCLLPFSATILPRAQSQQALGIVTCPFLVTRPLSFTHNPSISRETLPLSPWQQTVTTLFSFLPPPSSQIQDQLAMTSCLVARGNETAGT